MSLRRMGTRQRHKRGAIGQWVLASGRTLVATLERRGRTLRVRLNWPLTGFSASEATEYFTDIRPVLQARYWMIGNELGLVGRSGYDQFSMNTLFAKAGI